tara:strand:- start:7604 stop:8422 length:819 start_codon:yes stop_codon:yes gene_type:complete
MSKAANLMKKLTKTAGHAMGHKKAPAKKSKFGMLSVKAGIDNNPAPTKADRIAGAKMKKEAYGGSYGKPMKKKPAKKKVMKKKASFKQKFITAYMEKNANTMMGKAQGWLPYLAASIVAGSVLQGMQAVIDKIIEKVEEHGHKAKGKDYYKKMLEAHPSLMKEDPEVVAKYWDSLYHFAPQMGQDPLAAGAYIRQSIDRGLEDVGGPSPDMVKNLTDIDGSLTRTKAARKPGNKIVDVGQFNPGKDIASILMREDVHRNPEDWGIPKGPPKP